MSNVFDVAIIGAGVAGAFAIHKLAKEHKGIKVVLIDVGVKPAKRRQQMIGWLGCLPSSDGKFYLSDQQKVANLVGNRKAKSALTQFNKIISNIGDFKIIKDKPLSPSLEKRLAKIDYEIQLNDYLQMYPRDIHALSKYIVSVLENYQGITYSFDNEVRKIRKEKRVFVITTDLEEFRAKKLILAVGRSGWRWAKEVYEDFGIIDNNDTARFGIRLELNSPNLKEFNKSNCTLIKPEVEIGPFSWFGTVIPEDHLDVAISSFRSNENRWKTDKVSFSLIGNRFFPNQGFEQTDRLSKLTFILANDRILKERTSHILSGKSKISVFSEYNWLKETLHELAQAIPEVATKSYYHVPTIATIPPSINIGSNLETEVGNMFVVGECAGTSGLLAAALMGLVSVDSVCR